MKLRKLLNLNEDNNNDDENVEDDGKINKDAVMYEGPQLNKMDFTCAGCIFFSRDDRCELLNPDIVGVSDGCNLWVGGEPSFHGETKKLVPKEVAGFMENGPFTCKRCRHFHQIDNSGIGECEIVKGQVHRDGCCNSWQRGEELDMSQGTSHNRPPSQPKY